MRDSRQQARQRTLTALREELGDQVWVADNDREPFLREWRGRYHGNAAAVLCPGRTDQVALILQRCHQAGIAVVPQGGNTGLVGGAAPDASGEQIILSLCRMNRIRELDTENQTLTAEAGCVLADLQAAAADADCLFPLSLASEGSCQIGGNLASNAGGTNVLHYGNARELTLGLEVVLADGRVWQGLKALRKDNSGYSLKDLFIGSEGTLGIITAAVLRLFPAIRHRATSLLAIASPEHAITLLPLLREHGGDQLTACELMSRNSLLMATEHVAGCRDPFDAPHPWYLLVELSSSGNTAPTDLLTTALADANDRLLLRDAVLAQSLEQASALWRLRESIPEGQVRHGASIKHDISLPVSRLPAFLKQASQALEAQIPGIRLCPFGHVGDGNLHYNLSQPTGMDRAAFMDHEPDCNRLVFDLVHTLGGSIAAEHGVGQLRRQSLLEYKDPVELELMNAVKQALDPQGLLNPGKVI